MSEPPLPPAAPEPAPPPPSPPAPAAVKQSGRSPLLRPALGILAVLAAFIAWEVFTSFVAYTDDAYVRSDLVALAPQVTGHLVTIAVVDDQPVHRGDLLARIDPVPFQLAVKASQAALQEANAEAATARDAIAAAQDELDAANAMLPDAEVTEQRALTLASAGFGSRQVHDNALAALRNTQANVADKQAALDGAKTQLAARQAAIANAEAALALAQWQLARTVIRAPVDGTVTNLNLQAGDTAQANTPLIGIVASGDWRVIANYKQSFLPSLHAGQTAWIWLDAHPWHFYRARIRSIGRGIARQPGDDGLLPYVAPTTDWIRLQHRFPVTVVLVNPPPDLTFYMGADARCLVFP